MSSSVEDESREMVNRETRADGEWKMTMHTGVLDYSGI
jgi:hypothetical protein